MEYLLEHGANKKLHLDDGQTVEDYLVPAGASFSADVSGTTPVDETMVKPQVRKPLGAKKAHKKHPIVGGAKPPQKK